MSTYQPNSSASSVLDFIQMFQSYPTLSSSTNIFDFQYFDAGYQFYKFSTPVVLKQGTVPKLGCFGGCLLLNDSFAASNDYCADDLTSITSYLHFRFRRLKQTKYVYEYALDLSQLTVSSGDKSLLSNLVCIEGSRVTTSTLDYVDSRVIESEEAESALLNCTKTAYTQTEQVICTLNFSLACPTTINVTFFADQNQINSTKTLSKCK